MLLTGQAVCHYAGRSLLGERMGFFRQVYGFISEIIDRRFMIYELSKRDFTSKYIASVVGIWWAILEPLSYVVILWFIFEKGFKGGITITYLVTGIIPFNFFRNALMEGAGSIHSYAFLVRKVDFRLSLLAVVKLSSNLTLFMLMFPIIVFILAVNGIYPSLHWLQLLYYIPMTCILALGLIWLTSAIEPFFPDIKNIINIIMQFLFFVTPLFWKASVLPAEIRSALRLNPLCYLIEGYRQSFLSTGWFWDSPSDTLYFIVFTAFVGLAGIWVFRKMKPHFADVVG